jgi:hypothetical protein
VCLALLLRETRRLAFRFILNASGGAPLSVNIRRTRRFQNFVRDTLPLRW